MKMPAGNKDLKIDDENYLKIDDSTLGATQQVGKKDSVNIEKVWQPELAGIMLYVIYCNCARRITEELGPGVKI